MSDLVERLRVDGFPYQSIKREAADRIEQLEAAIKQATEYGEVSFLGVNIPFENFNALRTALENKDG